MIPRTGSRGQIEDLWVLLNSACYEGGPSGHRWVPPEAIVEKAKLADAAFETGFGRSPEATESAHDDVPFDPRCKECRAAARRVLTLRAIPDTTIRRLFRLVGAKWTWVTPEKEQARRESDRGTAILDPERPEWTLETSVNRRERVRAKRIEWADRLADEEQRRRVERQAALAKGSRR